jgi:CTP synthase (UTP-ammonia lyase)
MVTMPETLKVGVIGGFDPARRSHLATDDALEHAAESSGLTVRISWIPTLSVGDGNDEMLLDPYDALWCAPGSPYESMDGALRGIRFARERGKPFAGT